MKRVCAVFVVCFLAGIFGSSSHAWEFEMRGKFLWVYDYFTETGTKGFFGTFDQGTTADAIGAAPNFRSPNAWVGARRLNTWYSYDQYGLVRGKDASFNYMRMELYPEISLNPAIRVNGWIQIGGGYHTNYGQYENSALPGGWTPIDTVNITQLWATAQTPWGHVVAGKRPFAFGMGAQYDGSTATSESLLAVAPYGPLRIGLGFYPHKRQLWVDTAAIPSVSLSRQMVSFTDFGNFSVQNWDHDSEAYGKPMGFITYRAGGIDMGLVYEWSKQHDGPQNAAINDEVNVKPTRDSTIEDGSVYFKYNNGRYFFNSEVAWVRVQSTYQPPRNPEVTEDAGGSLYAPYSNEAWKFMTELGVLCGPAKLSLFYSWVPGPDRRHGIWIKNQSWENIPWNGPFGTYPIGNLFGTAQAFLPYSLLMSYQYGAGLNAINFNGEGYMTDASSWGARVDYAVAANLNVYTTFFYANRVSKGWGWGTLVPVSEFSHIGVAVLGTNTAGANYTASQNNFALGAAAPNIPDDALGWELTGGADWRLLEGMSLSMRLAYWRPGRWFNFACVDKRLVTFTNATGPWLGQPTATDGAAEGLSWGVNPNRTIDPIWGFQTNLVFDF
jgi:hypothetical protein